MNKCVSIYKDDEKIADQVLLADTFFKRMFGLMPVKILEENKGLLICPCKQVHTFHMKYAIDVVFLSKGSFIVHIEHALVPSRITGYFKHAETILELNSGEAERHKLKLGERLLIKPYEKKL